MKKNIALVLLGAFILCFTSFYNRFPILTEDSGVCLDSGFKSIVPEGRTAIYGLFIVHTSWGISLWLVVFSQALILSLLIYYYFRYFSDSKKYQIYYLAFVFFITFLTSASLITSTISTGVFTCLSILAVGLLLFSDKLQKRDFFIISAIAVISLGVEIINLMSVIIIILIVAAGLAIKQLLSAPPFMKTSWYKITVSALIVFISWTMVSSLHYVVGNGFYFVDKNNTLTLVAEKTKAIKIDFLSNVFSEKMQFYIANYPRMSSNAETYSSSLAQWFNWELRECLLSKQYVNGLHFLSLSYTQIMVTITCILLFIYLVLNKSSKKYYTLFVFSIISFLIYLMVNALLFAEIKHLSWQVMWLLALPAFIYISDLDYEIDVTE